MNTAFFLMAQYNASVIPVDLVVRDYFPHLSTDKFVRKVSLGDIRLPMIRIEATTQKSAKGIHINDLAKYIDDRRDAALKEVQQLGGVRSGVNPRYPMAPALQPEAQQLGGPR